MFISLCLFISFSLSLGFPNGNLSASFFPQFHLLSSLSPKGLLSLGLSSGHGSDHRCGLSQPPFWRAFSLSALVCLCCQSLVSLVCISSLGMLQIPSQHVEEEQSEGLTLVCMGVRPGYCQRGEQQVCPPRAKAWWRVGCFPSPGTLGGLKINLFLMMAYV